MAGSKGCSARGCTPLLRIQISAHTRSDVCNRSPTLLVQPSVSVLLFSSNDSSNSNLAVCCSDHVYVVANYLEGEASVQQGKTTLQGDGAEGSFNTDPGINGKQSWREIFVMFPDKVIQFVLIHMKSHYIPIIFLKTLMGQAASINCLFACLHLHESCYR